MSVVRRRLAPGRAGAAVCEEPGPGQTAAGLPRSATSAGEAPVQPCAGEEGRLRADQRSGAAPQRHEHVSPLPTHLHFPRGGDGRGEVFEGELAAAHGAAAVPQTLPVRAENQGSSALNMGEVNAELCLPTILQSHAIDGTYIYCIQSCSAT